PWSGPRRRWSRPAKRSTTSRRLTSRRSGSRSTRRPSGCSARSSAEGIEPHPLVTMPDEHWPAYYAVTVDRPPWRTVLTALDRFATEDAATGRGPRSAVDLGCGAGRDAREILRRGWRVLAIDRELAAIAALEAATPAADRPRLDVLVADLDGV